MTEHFLDEEILEVQQLAYWGHTRKVWETLVCGIACVLWIYLLFVLERDKELKLFHVNQSR